MIVYPLKSDFVRPGDSIISVLTNALSKSRLRLRTGDILAVSSKIVAISEGSLRELDKVRPTADAKRIASEYSLSPSFVQTVIEEAERIVGGVKGTLLTIKCGDAVPNAGVDRKNAPKGSVVLWPRNPDLAARKIRDTIQRMFGKSLGVVIVDSRVTPLRLGTTGFAIGSAGFKPIEDVRGRRDLSGRRIEITFRAVADGIAAAAHLVMAEASEKKPFAIVRESPAQFGTRGGISSAKLSWDQCLYMSQIM